MTTPRRRWSFGLRTMFVVVSVTAIPLGLVAWQVHFVHERQHALSELRHAGGKLIPSCPGGGGMGGTFSHDVPLVRGWLGDEPVGAILLPSQYGSEVANWQATFPEAIIETEGMPDSRINWSGR